MQQRRLSVSKRGHAGGEMNKRQKRELIIIVAIIIVAAVTGALYSIFLRPEEPNTTRGAFGKPMKKPKVAAKVNGKDILSEEVEAYYRSNLGLKGVKEDQITESMRHQYLYEALETIIEERMLVEGAAKMGISMSPEEIEELFNKKVVPNFKDQAELEASLMKDLGLTVGQLKSRISLQELAAKVKAKLGEGIKVTDEEAAKEQQELEGILKSHPGGKVEVPSQEEIKQQLLSKKVDSAYAVWLESLTSETEIEIVDPAFEQNPDAVKEEPSPEVAGAEGQAEPPDEPSKP